MFPWKCTFMIPPFGFVELIWGSLSCYSRTLWSLFLWPFSHQGRHRPSQCWERRDREGKERRDKKKRISKFPTIKGAWWRAIHFTFYIVQWFMQKEQRASETSYFGRTGGPILPFHLVMTLWSNSLLRTLTLFTLFPFTSLVVFHPFVSRVELDTQKNPLKSLRKTIS